MLSFDEFVLENQIFKKEDYDISVDDDKQIVHITLKAKDWSKEPGMWRMIQQFLKNVDCSLGHMINKIIEPSDWHLDDEAKPPILRHKDQHEVKIEAYLY